MPSTQPSVPLRASVTSTAACYLAASSVQIMVLIWEENTLSERISQRILGRKRESAFVPGDGCG
jgi:hypothetical protein